MTVARRSILAFALLLLTTLSLTMTRPGATPRAAAQAPCSILALDMGNAWDTESVDTIGGVNYTLVSPAAFATTDLSQYDALYVASAFQDPDITVASQASLDALNARAADIATFVSNGGGLVGLSEPIGTGRFSWVPLAVTPGAREDLEIVTILHTGHAVHVGLTSAALSFWHQSSHHTTTPGDPQYTVITTTGPGGPLSVYAFFGDGRIYLTGQDPDFHTLEVGGASPPDPGAKTLLANALNWSCAPEAVGGEVVLPDLTGVPLQDATDSGDPLGSIALIASAAAAALLLSASFGYVLHRLRR
jgi:hypothetical protein